MDMLSVIELPSEWPAMAAVPLEQILLITKTGALETELGPPFMGGLRNSEAYKSGWALVAYNLITELISFAVIN